MAAARPEIYLGKTNGIFLGIEVDDREHRARRSVRARSAWSIGIGENGRLNELTASDALAGGRLAAREATCPSAFATSI